MDLHCILMMTILAPFLHLPAKCLGESEVNWRSKIESPPLLPQLSCHVCHSVRNATCINLLDKKQNVQEFPESCHPNEGFCMVKHITFPGLEGNERIVVNRTCAVDCEPGCVTEGVKIKIVTCYSCCTSPLCNAGCQFGSIFFKLDSLFFYSMAFVSFKLLSNA